MQGAVGASAEIEAAVGVVGAVHLVLDQACSALSIGLAPEIASRRKFLAMRPWRGLIGRFFHYGRRAVRGNLVQDEGRVSLVVNRQPVRIRTLLEVR
jgi:hypothetical protein